MTLDGSGSSDPDAGDTLVYRWDFGDGSPAVETTSANTTHSYPAGSFTASLTVRDTRGATSSPDTVRIDSGNTAPQPTIASPAAGQRFAVGETLTLSGSATDPQEGTLPSTALSWTVIRHHASHTHPYFGPTPGTGLQVTGPAPEDLAAAATNSHLEVRLTATDSQGLSATRHAPRRSQAGERDLRDQAGWPDTGGERHDLHGTANLPSWEGYDLTVSAPAQGRYVFSSWSDGGAATHTIRTPPSARTYTATFRKGPRR